MISSEYGWDDEKINELHFGRFVQIIATIRTRKYHRSREESTRLSWAVRTISSYVAAGYMMDEKSENKALEQAGKLTLDRVEEAYLGFNPVQDSDDGWKPGMPAIIPDDKIPSFEKMMTAFGRM